MKVTRRDFGRLSAMTVLAGGLPLRARAGSGPHGRKLRWCIVALGRISMGQFMPGLMLSKTGKITVLVSGHRQKAENQAAVYNVPASSIYGYENFDEIRHNEEIDAVYIALPNSMHAEYTIRAAQAGKHVLCEKPMATSLADCRAMIAACRKANGYFRVHASQGCIYLDGFNYSGMHLRAHLASGEKHRST